MELDDYLKATYYNPKHPAGYSGVQRLYEAARREGFPKVKLSEVKKWALGEEVYGVMRTARRKFPRSSVVIAGLDHQFECDLMDYSRLRQHNKDYSFVLVVIDVFSRYCWTRPMVTKKGPETVKQLKDIFSEGRQPKYSLRSDKGPYHHVIYARLMSQHC